MRSTQPLASGARHFAPPRNHEAAAPHVARNFPLGATADVVERHRQHTPSGKFPAHLLLNPEAPWEPHDSQALLLDGNR